MDVRRGLCWGGSRSTKPCVYPCEVAAACMKGTVCVCVCVCAGVAPAVVRTLGSSCVLQRVVVHVRVVLFTCEISGCRPVEWLHQCCHVAVP